MATLTTSFPSKGGTVTPNAPHLAAFQIQIDQCRAGEFEINVGPETSRGVVRVAGAKMPGQNALRGKPNLPLLSQPVPILRSCARTVSRDPSALPTQWPTARTADHAR